MVDQADCRRHHLLEVDSHLAAELGQVALCHAQGAGARSFASPQKNSVKRKLQQSGLESRVVRSRWELWQPASLVPSNKENACKRKQQERRRRREAEIVLDANQQHASVIVAAERGDRFQFPGSLQKFWTVFQRTSSTSTEE